MTLDYSSKYRNVNGLAYTKGLFQEMATTEDTVLYTLKDQDTYGLPSLYRLYMEVADPTEYRFATQYMDGWGHWEDLCLCPWFKPYIDRWRRELEVRIRSEALNRITREAMDGNEKTLMQSNRYLAEGTWMPKDMRKAGRPTKAMIEKETKRLADIEKQVEEDLQRVQDKVK